LEDVYPLKTPLTIDEEVLVPADAPIVAYREWLAKFDVAGWRINVEEFNRLNGNSRAFSIPSPGRNESENYPIEPIPLIKTFDEHGI
jgi:hypothetical protein